MSVGENTYIELSPKGKTWLESYLGAIGSSCFIESNYFNHLFKFDRKQVF